MAMQAIKEPAFSWGDTVTIKKSAPAHLHPGELASVCSVIKIDPEDVRKDPSLIEPTWLYTVEFGDGSSIDLPEFYLKPYEAGKYKRTK
jgi:hypothetical protein